MTTKGMTRDEVQMLHNEISIMQRVDHPHVAKYYETY